MAFASSRIGAQEAIIILCDLCEEEEEVNWFCKDCGQNMCNRCKKSHLRAAVSKNHELLSISEGFVIGKQNVQNMCDDHTEVFSFYCRTCKCNICAKCLSQNHKKHDFVALREVQEELQSKLNDILKQKGEEMESIAENIDSLSRYKKDFHSYIAACYTSIEENVQAIKDCAESDGKKLMSRLSAIEEKANGEIDETEQNLKTQKNSYSKKISDTERELRMQTNASLPGFVEKSQSELQNIKPILAKIPANIALFSDGKINADHIRDMIGRIDKVPETGLLMQGEVGRDVRKPILRNQINVVGSIRERSFLNEVFSVCLSRDGIIWVGGKGVVLKVEMNGEKVLSKIDAREGLGFKYACQYIACFKSDGAIVSYGGAEYIDKFTTDGKRIDFANVSPSTTHDIAVTDENQVVVNVNRNSLVIFSEQGEKLREIKPSEISFETFCLLQDGSYRIADNWSSYLITVDRKGQVTRRQEISKSDILYTTCDRHGNVIASNESGDSIYVISEEGDHVRTYQIPGKEIGRLAVDNKDRLLILTDGNIIHGWQEITVAEYIE